MACKSLQEEVSKTISRFFACKSITDHNGPQMDPNNERLSIEQQQQQQIDW